MTVKEEREVKNNIFQNSGNWNKKELGSMINCLVLYLICFGPEIPCVDHTGIFAGLRTEERGDQDRNLDDIEIT